MHGSIQHVKVDVRYSYGDYKKHSTELTFLSPGRTCLASDCTSRVTTGNGNDWISGYNDTVVHAGNGNSVINAYGNSRVTSGDDADMIDVGNRSTVFSGGGDDKIKVRNDAIIHAGKGDDQVTLRGRGSTIHFERGDGNDIIGGGTWGYALDETENISSSVIAFGSGIASDELSFQSQANDLLISIGQGDSITVKDYQRHGIPSMTFADGTTLKSENITKAMGPAEPYRLTSELLQNWHDANMAYRESAETDTTKSDLVTKRDA